MSQMGIAPYRLIYFKSLLKGTLRNFREHAGLITQSYDAYNKHSHRFGFSQV